jgi:predicted protein tyrosine phosphatase
LNMGLQSTLLRIANEPRRSITMTQRKPHILFVCGRNLWRSPTAFEVFKRDQRVDVRSAGVSSKSKHQISEKDLLWADLVLVMERRHASRILGVFRHVDPFPLMDSLEIPDEYQYMDEELVERIIEGTEFHLNHRFNIEHADSLRRPKGRS